MASSSLIAAAVTGSIQVVMSAREQEVAENRQRELLQEVVREVGEDLVKSTRSLTLALEKANAENRLLKLKLDELTSPALIYSGVASLSKSPPVKLENVALRTNDIFEFHIEPAVEVRTTNKSRRIGGIKISVPSVETERVFPKKVVLVAGSRRYELNPANNKVKIESDASEASVSFEPSPSHIEHGRVVYSVKRAAAKSG